MGYSDRERERAYQRAYYLANREKRIAAAALGAQKTVAKAYAFIRELKSVPCTDCGNKYHFCAMQFDHVRGVKHFDIGARGHVVSRARLLAEIEKCEVVCANCHAIRTFKRRRASLA